MIFLWSSSNERHITRHRVAPAEAESVVEGARNPFPRSVGDDKHAVWGRTKGGRFLQVIFVYSLLEDVNLEEYATLKLHERIAMEEGAEAIRVIHARELTRGERRKLRRKRGK